MDNWEQHKTEDGKLYYTNTLSGEKSWVKPEQSTSENPTNWTEQTTQSGKTYFQNTKTGETSWEIPSELQAWKNQIAAMQLQKNLEAVMNIEEEEEGQIPDEQEDFQVSDPKQVYLQLFREAGVTSTWKWEDFHRIMKDDDRYLTIRVMSEKKQIFQEYIQTLKRKEREEARQKKQVARENFMKMLDSSGILKAESKFHKTAHFFQGDPRWRILEEKEREELFQDFLDELERRDKEKQRHLRKQQMQSLKKVLEDKEEIDHTTKWFQAQKLLAGNSQFEALDKLDQLSVFSEYILEAEKKEAEKKRSQDKTNARKNRENFKSLLEEAVGKGELTAATHWKDFILKIREDPRYFNLVGQAGSTPKELFDEVKNAQKEKLKDQIEYLQDSLHNFTFNTETTYEEVRSRAKEAYESLSEPTREIVLQVVTDQNVDYSKEEYRKLKKSVKKFDEFLKLHPEISAETKFEDIVQSIDTSKFKRITQEDMKARFERYIDKLKEEEQGSDVEPGEIKHRSKKDKKKKHKTHRHESPHKKYKKKHRSRSRSSTKYK